MGIVILYQLLFVKSYNLEESDDYDRSYDSQKTKYT